MMQKRNITGKVYIVVILLSLLPVPQVLAGENHLVWLQRMIDQHTVVVQQDIASSWVLQKVPAMEISSVIAAKVAADGTVSDARVVKSSGDSEFDRSAQVAVTRASPLPVAADPEVMDQFRHLTFEFRTAGNKAVTGPIAGADADNVATGYANYARVKLPIIISR